MPPAPCSPSSWGWQHQEMPTPSLWAPQNGDISSPSCPFPAVPPSHGPPEMSPTLTPSVSLTLPRQALEEALNVQASPPPIFAATLEPAGKVPQQELLTQNELLKQQVGQEQGARWRWGAQHPPVLRWTHAPGAWCS